MFVCVIVSYDYDYYKVKERRFYDDVVAMVADLRSYAEYKYAYGKIYKDDKVWGEFRNATNKVLIFKYVGSCSLRVEKSYEYLNAIDYYSKNIKCYSKKT